MGLVFLVGRSFLVPFELMPVTAFKASGKCEWSFSVEDWQPEQAGVPSGYIGRV